MCQDVRRTKALHEARFVPSARRYLFVDYISFMDELGRMIGCTPPNFRQFTLTFASRLSCMITVTDHNLTTLPKNSLHRAEVRYTSTIPSIRNRTGADHSGVSPTAASLHVGEMPTVVLVSRQHAATLTASCGF